MFLVQALLKPKKAERNIPSIGATNEWIANASVPIAAIINRLIKTIANLVLDNTISFILYLLRFKFIPFYTY